MNTIKISVMGDIMCEQPLLEAARKEGGGYDFSEVFSGLKSFCSQSDYVIANLETPFAGKAAGYTREMYSFNTPDSFADAVKAAGIDLVLTANNHCCDRGIAGLERTLRILDEKGIPHTGTFSGDGDNAVHYADVKGVRLAVISCTASTNAPRTKCEPTLDNVNLLDEQSSKSGKAGVSIASRAKTAIVRHVIGEHNWIKIRIALGKDPKKPSIDNALNKERVDVYLDRIGRYVQEAKREGAIVVVCPHMGGQFNVEPGVFSKYAMGYLASSGADAVVASHPHIVQRVEFIGNVPCAYSVGNVSMSMCTPYILKNDLPDYGLITNLYCSGDGVERVTFTLIKGVENHSGMIRARLVSDLLEEVGLDRRESILRDSSAVVSRLTNREVLLRHVPEEIGVYVQGGGISLEMEEYFGEDS